jgi:methylenetetrahydrofolate reductase (NADPH)
MILLSSEPWNEPHATARMLARTADLEIIPLRGVVEKLVVVPPSTRITITCSPRWGIERTLEYTASVIGAGYRAVPHLAARQVADERELRGLVERLTDLGVRDLFVIGGDAPEPAGAFDSAGSLLDAVARIGHQFETIGVACYPEGHPRIADDQLLEALRLKQQHATYMVSQLCFDIASLTGWLPRARARGITLPLHVGLAGPLKARKLMELSVKIGVGSSIRYLTKQHGFIKNMLRGDSYRPETLLDDMGRALDTEALRIGGIHLYSFNQIADTVEWQRRIAGGTQA